MSADRLLQVAIRIRELQDGPETEDILEELAALDLERQELEYALGSEVEGIVGYRGGPA